jgi:YbgC/YbaW family acyl-CoA thioester hydrolase
VHQFRWKHRVAFAETDMAGIVHFSNYFRYMEQAEHAFLRSLGLTVHARGDDTAASWPRVHAECRYTAPLTFEDEFEVHLLVREKSRKTIRYDFRLIKDGQTPVATGSVTVVCVAIDRATGKMTTMPIPPEVDALIEPAPAELLAAE